MSLKPIEIGPVSWRLLLFFRLKGKRLNKRLLAILPGFNISLSGRAELLAALKLQEADLDLLLALAQRPEGGGRYIYKKAGGAALRLAEQGLILFNWPVHKIRLSDAGRFLLTLAAPSEYPD